MGTWQRREVEWVDALYSWSFDAVQHIYAAMHLLVCQGLVLNQPDHADHVEDRSARCGPTHRRTNHVRRQERLTLYFTRPELQLCANDTLPVKELVFPRWEAAS